MKFYVYIHRKKTDGSIFYVGKGHARRAYDKRESKRSTYWIRTVNKYGFTVEICQDAMSEKDAFLLEMWLIAKFRHEGCNLVNMTDGGEGPVGIESTRRIAIRCSNGMGFAHAVEARDWLRNNGFPTACKASVRRAVAGVSHTAYGMSWWKDGEEEKEVLTEMELSVRSKGKFVYCSNGMEFRAVREAARWLRDNGHPKAVPSNIANCCNGKVMTAYGYVWSFKKVSMDNPEHKWERTAKKLRKPVMTICGLEFPSASEAATWLRNNRWPKAKQGNISTACSKGGGMAYGYFWMFNNSI